MRVEDNARRIVSLLNNFVLLRHGVDSCAYTRCDRVNSAPTHYCMSSSVQMLNVSGFRLRLDLVTDTLSTQTHTI